MSKKSIFDYQLDILIKEIERIGNLILHLDDISFKIKGLAVTVWAIIVGWGVQATNPELVSISIPVLLFTWSLDALFKSYQRRSRARMAYIEDFMNNVGKFKNDGLREAFQKQSFDKFIIYDPIGRLSYRTDEEFLKYYKKRTNFWRCLLVSSVGLLHLALLICSFIIITLVRYVTL